MESEFLSFQEQNYLLSKAELLKVDEKINNISIALKESFGYKENGVSIYSGLRIEVSLILDKLTPEEFDKKVPDIKRKLAEYHRLRLCRKEIEKRLNMVCNHDSYDVVKKNK